MQIEEVIETLYNTYKKKKKRTYGLYYESEL